MTYWTGDDPLCYPGTSVLVNLAGIKDTSNLEQFELAMYVSRAQEGLPDGDLSYRHYLALHHHLFQDVYSWAGTLRTIRISKGQSVLCYPEHLERVLEKTLAPPTIDQILQSDGKWQFAGRAAQLLGEINAAHPFREGNGRTQLAYLNMLAAEVGHGFDADALDPERVLHAMIASFNFDYDPLTRLIFDVVA